jgi:hypothetical protein
MPRCLNEKIKGSLGDRSERPTSVSPARGFTRDHFPSGLKLLYEWKDPVAEYYNSSIGYIYSFRNNRRLTEFLSEGSGGKACIVKLTRASGPSYVTDRPAIRTYLIRSLILRVSQ